MAKIKLNPLFENITGELEGYVFRRTPSGKTIISRKPDMSKVKSSPAQIAQQENFKQATAYAHLALQDPEMATHYEQVAQLAHRTPYQMAISGYFRVHRLQLE